MTRKTRPSTRAALLHIEDAMELVALAQANLERAAQKLSSIRHGSDLYSRAGKLRDSCHTLWYVLDKVANGNHLGPPRQEMSLDSEPEVK